MQQATVNLFADMGAQPATLQAGLVGRDGIDRHDRADLDDHLAAGGRDSAERAPPITITRHGDRRGRRRRRRRRGLDRRRHDLAPGRPAATTGPTPGRRPVDGTATIRRRAVDDSGNLETPATGHRRRSAAPRPARARSGATAPLRAIADDADASAVELGVKFRSDVAGYITGAPLLQGHGEHRHARRAPLDARPARCSRTATFTSETAIGLAAGRPSDARSPITANTTYVASYHAHAGHYAATTATSPTTGVDNAPLHALADGVDGGNGVYATARQRLPDQHLQRRPTTGSTSSSSRRSARTRRRRRSPRVTPAQRRDRRRDRRRRDGDVQRGDRRRRRSRRDVRAARPPNALGPGHGHLQRGQSRRRRCSPTAALRVLDDLHGDGQGRRPTGVKDLAGNALAADVTWSFTTAAPPPPPPDEGPGGPILVVATRPIRSAATTPRSCAPKG